MLYEVITDVERVGEVGEAGQVAHQHGRIALVRAEEHPEEKDHVEVDDQGYRRTPGAEPRRRITSYNVCYTKLLRPARR